MLTQPRPSRRPRAPASETNHILESQIHHFPGLDPRTARTPPCIVGRVRCFMDVCLQLISARYRQVPLLNRITRSTDISNMKVDIPCLRLRSQLKISLPLCQSQPLGQEIGLGQTAPFLSMSHPMRSARLPQTSGQPRQFLELRRAHGASFYGA
mgnify:CR=1 FL=1